MISEPVLVDTGPLVAILRDDDQHHARCVHQASELVGLIYSCWPVLTEAAWLLRNVPGALEQLLDMVALEDVTRWFPPK